MASNTTIRVTDNTAITTAAADDELLIVDKSDLTASPDGTDRKIIARDLLENTSVRPISEPTVIKKLNEWIQQFKNDITTVVDRTQDATTTNFGVVQFATADQAKAKTRYDRALSAGVLSSLGSTETLAGLIALATQQQVAEGQSTDTAVTPYTLFQSILGDGVIGNSSWTFKIPIRNVVGDVKMELIVQIGQANFSTMVTNEDPTSNYNHIHQSIDFDVVYPEQFPTLGLMVIPMAFEATPSQYEEGTDFWIRPKEVRNNGATLRATRIGGTSPGDEEAGVRYLAIGF